MKPHVFVTLSSNERGIRLIPKKRSNDFKGDAVTDLNAFRRECFLTAKAACLTILVISKHPDAVAALGVLSLAKTENPECRYQGICSEVTISFSSRPELRQRALVLSYRNP
jgi:hypothetical protein